MSTTSIDSAARNDNDDPTGRDTETSEADS